jgi:hypothetical protein
MWSLNADVDTRGGKRFNAWLDQDSHLLAYRILIDEVLGPDGMDESALIRGRSSE